MTEAVELFKCLGDQTRFSLLCLLYRSDSYVELLAEQLQLTPGTVSFHLKKMEKAGIVRCSRTQYYIIYSLDRSRLEKTPLQFLETMQEKQDGEAAYRKKVLTCFFKGDRLLSIPVQQKKREIVLREITSRFSKGHTYMEEEVKALLEPLYVDYCTLRRAMVSEGYLTRDGVVYWVTQ